MIIFMLEKMFASEVIGFEYNGRLLIPKLFCIPL